MMASARRIRAKFQEFGSYEIRKYQENLKPSYSSTIVFSLPLKMKILSILAKKFCKIETELFP